LVLEVLVLESDPREMEDAIKKGMRPEAPLCGDQGTVRWGKSSEVEGGSWMDPCDDRKQDLSEPRVDMVLVEERSKIPEKVREVELAVRVKAS
jgi:hypothetical protein